MARTKESVVTQSFRQAMAWLHTWFGLVLGFVLMAAFFFGALSVFDREIDRWAIPSTRYAPQPMPSFDKMLRPVFEGLQPKPDEIEALRGRYDVVNIKLDKCGGLTEALALAAEARARGFRIMVGCMLGTSLGIAPAALAAQGADWIDLDGALLLAQDRDGGLPMRDGLLHPGSLWGQG